MKDNKENQLHFQKIDNQILKDSLNNSQCCQEIKKCSKNNSFENLISHQKRDCQKKNKVWNNLDLSKVEELNKGNQNSNRI